MTYVPQGNKCPKCGGALKPIGAPQHQGKTVQNSLAGGGRTASSKVPLWLIISLGLIVVLLIVVIILFIVTGMNNNTSSGRNDDEAEEYVIYATDATEATEAVEPEVEEPYNVLVLGEDVEAGLTDVIMLCRVDPEKEKATILSIPRDTKVKVKGTTMKINGGYSVGGVNQMINSVETLTGVNVDYYFLINLEAFRDIVDAVDGVYYTVPRNMDYEDPLQDLYIHLKKGYQHLDGNEAEQLVRFRQYPNGDVDRIRVQQNFIDELISQKLNTQYVDKIPRVYNIIRHNSNTDMTVDKMLSAGTTLMDFDRDNIESYIVPGEGQYIGDVSYYIADTDSLEEIIEENFE